MLFSSHRHHIPQNTLTGETHGGTIKFIKQQYMLGGATIFAPQTATLVVAKRFSSIRKKLTSTPSEAAQLSSRLHLRCSNWRSIRYRARIDDKPRYPGQRRLALRTRCAAHGVYTSNWKLTFSAGPVLTFHDTVQARSGSGVEFHQACKGKCLSGTLPSR